MTPKGSDNNGERGKSVRTVCNFLSLCIALVIGSSGQTFTTLASFDGVSGSSPNSLVQATDGNLYGTAFNGGTTSYCASFCGTLFKITPDGKLTTIYTFCSQSDCTDGFGPYAGLTQGSDGNLYGTTWWGGARGKGNGVGTVYKITPKGKLTTLYSFCAQANCTDGFYPYGALIQASDGNFYGTTEEGGIDGDCGGFIGCGTVFKISRTGRLTTIYSFCSQANCADGALPRGPLVQGMDGNFYGMTYFGGSACNYYCGTVYRITPSGAVTTLHSFQGYDGDQPAGGLVQAIDGTFYGTTSYTIFKITPDGTLTTLESFEGTNGSSPNSLVQAGDGNFYGTTSYGGAYMGGTAFEISPAGSWSDLYDFCFESGCSDGRSPFAGLLQHTNGSFYGTTWWGGVHDDGTIFNLSVGLGRFVETQAASGKVGAGVIILGNDLAGTTGVSFGGTPSTFTAKSTFIKAKVPNGATTGTVTVSISSGTLLSRVPFRVTPQLKSFSPKSGSVGTQVTITGVSLTQTSGVSIGGVATTEFTVNSDTQVTAIIPEGAQTGAITIITAGGIATSKGHFRLTK